MTHNCTNCGMQKIPLGTTCTICPRCDTVAQGSGLRVGPPSMPGTREGWFQAPFGDKR